MSERTPLLSDSEAQTTYLEASDLTISKKAWLHELIKISVAAIPISLSFAVQNIVQACSIMFVGRIGTFELGVASYGYMFATCTGSMVAIGGSTALDTLCGQVFDPEPPLKSSKILGTYLQRGILVLSTLYCAVIVPVWWFSSSLFVALGQDDDFARATGMFLRFMIPGGLLQVIAECLKKFLQVQHHSYAVGWAMSITGGIGVLANFCLVRTGLGLWGAPLANLIYNLINVFILASYVCYQPILRTNLPWNGSTIFQDLTRFSLLAVTGILTVATEWWSFEILAMMAAALDRTTVGAQSILMTSDLILTTVSLGLGVAVSHRIGNLLGANDPSYAKFASKIAHIIAILIGLVEFVLVMASKNVYGRLFSEDKHVIALTAQVLPLMAGFQVLDLANGGAGGVLRGAGKNHLSGMCNFFGYYAIGLTTSWFLGFKLHWGLFGLWSGIITGSFALLLFQVFFIWRIDWKEEAKLISERGD